jgi:predicted RNase H-like nuclease (RuvC/YqgF family)
LKQLLLDLRDAVKYWKSQTREAERRLDVATRENQRLQAELEAAVKFNEDRHAMFVEAKTEVANLQANLQNADHSWVQLEVRIRTLEKERKLLFGALFVCVGLVAACWMPWSM